MLTITELTTKLESDKNKWTEKIIELNKKMKNVVDLTELMVDVYSDRQMLVDYYTSLSNMLNKINKEYRIQYNKRFSYWNFESHIKYNNSKALENKIYTEISDIIERRDLFDTHIKFILETKNTIDNIIYAIPKRIELEHIITGAK